MLMELLFWRKYAGTRKTSLLLFVDNSMQIFLRYISLRIWEDVCHTYHIVTRLKFFKIKINKWWVSVSAQIFLALWTLVPRAHAALFEYMPLVRVLENITFCSLFANPFHDFNHHRNQQQPPFLFSSEIWKAALSSLSLSVFRACNDFCVSLSLSIWLRNVIVRYKLFGIIAYSAEHRKSFFLWSTDIDFL